MHTYAGAKSMARDDMHGGLHVLGHFVTPDARGQWDSLVRENNSLSLETSLYYHQAGEVRQHRMKTTNYVVARFSGSVIFSIPLHRMIPVTRFLNQLL
jgi:hypothetical protein